MGREREEWAETRIRKFNRLLFKTCIVNIKTPALMNMILDLLLYLRPLYFQFESTIAIQELLHF